MPPWIIRRRVLFVRVGRSVSDPHHHHRGYHRPRQPEGLWLVVVQKYVCDWGENQRERA